MPQTNLILRNRCDGEGGVGSEVMGGVGRRKILRCQHTHDARSDHTRAATSIQSSAGAHAHYRHCHVPLVA